MLGDRWDQGELRGMGLEQYFGDGVGDASRSIWNGGWVQNRSPRAS